MEDISSKNSLFDAKCGLRGVINNNNNIMVDLVPLSISEQPSFAANNMSTT